MFIQRLISGIILVAIMIAMIVTGDLALIFTLLFISLVGVFELLRVFKMEKTIAAYINYLAAAGMYAALYLKMDGLVNALPIILFLVLMIYYVFTFPKYQGEIIFSVFSSFVYVAWMISYIYRLRVTDGGAYIVWLIFLASWGSDTCAYCVGMLCKKFLKTHQMTPKLSPKKSIEGGIGGLLGASLLGMIYGIIFADKMPIFGNYTVVACVLMSFCGACVSMIGDLCASAIKRNHGVKDYGHLIPGHGGIMDRFDSILFAAPAIYYVAMAVTYFL